MITVYACTVKVAHACSACTPIEVIAQGSYGEHLQSFGDSPGSCGDHVWITQKSFGNRVGSCSEKVSAKLAGQGRGHASMDEQSTHAHTLK